MKAKTIPVKGLHTPRLLLFMMGLFHGKVFHSGGLDLETNLITSAYISGQTKRYHHACAVCIEEVEERLSVFWTDADRLLLRLEELDGILSDLGDINQDYSSNTLRRLRDREVTKRNKINTEKQQKMQRLVELFNAILEERNIIESQFAATAESMSSSFSAYGHGLIMKPLSIQNIPILTSETYVDLITERHRSTWDKMKCVLEKGEK